MVVFSLQAYLIAFIGLMISLGGALFAYLISTVGGFPQLKGWAQKEFKELIFSALIIFLGFFLLHHVVLQLCLALVGAPATTTVDNPIYFTQAKIFLRILDLNMQELAFKGIKWNAALSGYGGYGITLGFPVVGTGGMGGFIISSSFVPLQSLTLIGKLIGEITKTVIMTNFAISIMDSMLFFIETTSFTIFFPMGIILRAFPITRKLGSTIIALVISFYFVFPLSILFNQYLYFNMIMGDFSYDNEDPVSVAELERTLETSLEDETQIEANIDESPFEVGVGEPTFDETLEAFGGEVQEEKQPTGGFGSGITEKLKNFISTIKNIIEGTKNVIDTILDLVFTGVLKGVSGWLGNLVQVLFGINLGQFIKAPVHYAVSLADQVLEKFVFVAFCLFMDVIFCLTLFANISGILGGETKILGIEKLKLG